MSKDDRRTFLKKSFFSLVAFGGASESLSSCRAKEVSPARSRLFHEAPRVVVIRLKEPVEHPINRQALDRMLDRAVAELTGLKPDAGWRLLFKPEDRVGLKVNTLAGKGISTHPELASALALKISQTATVKPGNIIIWDRENAELERAGYTLQPSRSAIRCFGTDQPGFGYRKKLSTNGHVCGMLSSILTDHTTVTVNVPVLKDHNLAGLSGSLKNMYGVIHNPNKYHDNNCDPFVAQLNSLPEIKRSQGLIVVDALKVQYEGGPGYHARYTVPLDTIIVGLDPVAVDMVQLGIVNATRLQHGLKPLNETDHPARHLATAGRPPYNLGFADTDTIEEIRIEV